MDSQIAAIKFEKIGKPVQRPITVSVTPAPVAQPPAATAVDPEQPAAGVTPIEGESLDAENLIPQDPYESSPMFHELAQFFNVEPKFYEATKDKISVITDWAITKTGSNKVEDIFHAIRSLEENLYRPGWDETRLDTIYKYLRIASKRDSFNKALKAFERGPMPHATDR